MVHVAVFLIRAYQLLLSPLLPFNSCRYHPSCSEYSIEALRRHGAFRGGLLTLKRILRCHPLSRRNVYDPVP
jgi:hypothetical protein